MKQIILITCTILMFSACSRKHYPTNITELNDNNPSTAYITEANHNSIVFTGFTDTMKHYKVFSSGESPESDPKGWVLYGSDNGRKWVEIDRRNNVDFCSRFQESGWTITKPSNYAQYKLTVTPATGQEKIAIGDVRLSKEDENEKWKDFVYPDKVVFTIDNPESEGAKAYMQLVKDPEEYARYHARKVAETLFYSADDTMHIVRTINYKLKDFKGVAYKEGSGDEITVNFSTQHIVKSAGESLYTLDFETRGVLYHELVHGYQYSPKGCGNYGNNKTFWSCIEGVADAVRAHAGHFDMATRKPGGNWLDGYRTTGFFIDWMTLADPDAIRKFHKTVLDLEVWSWDAAIKSLFGPEASIESKWEEYQQFLINEKK